MRLRFQILRRPWVKQMARVGGRHGYPNRDYRGRQWDALARLNPRPLQVVRFRLPETAHELQMSPRDWFAEFGNLIPFPAPASLQLTAVFFFNKSKAGADLYNLVQGLCDILNGVLWDDDSQVCRDGGSRIVEQSGLNCVDFTIEHAAPPTLARVPRRKSTILSPEVIEQCRLSKSW